MSLKNILIVDDEEAILKFCMKILSSEGYEVTGVSSGEEALKILPEKHFDMLITDMLLPGMNGLEIFQTLRRKRPGLIGILITGQGTIDMAIQAVEEGLNGFVRKPFVPDEIIRVVEDAFVKAELSEENTRLKTLIPLYDLMEKFLSSQSTQEIFDELVSIISQQTGAGRISLMMYDEQNGILKIVAARGFDSEIVEKTRLKPGERLAGKVFVEGSPLIINGGPKKNPHLKKYLFSKNIVTTILLPLKGRENTLGVINISKTKRGVLFTESDIELISIICHQAVMAIENFKIIDEKAEKMRVRTLLEQYLAPEVTEMIVSSGENLLEVGEIKNTVILFADIRNFTPIVREMPLDMIRSFMNDFYGLFSEVIFNYKGTMNKFMGDAVLAFFGAPVQIDDPENAALDTANTLHKTFNELIDVWAEDYELLGRMGLGIGITSGEVFLGNVGSSRRFDYTVIGTEVNIAQRLSSDAVSGETLISESVKQRLKSRIEIINESSRELKGIEKPVTIFSIISDG